MGTEQFTGLSIHLDGDNAWPDLRAKVNTPALETAPIASVCVLQGGMESGAPSVSFRIDLPGGKTVVGQTSFKLLLMAVDAFKAKYGDPRYAPPTKKSDGN